jgi:nucleoid DNA-binding protein
MFEPELIEAVAAEVGASRSLVDEVVAACKDVIKRELAAGGAVRLSGMGWFKLRRFGGRRVRNPKSGLCHDVPELHLPSFKTAATWLNEHKLQRKDRPMARRKRTPERSRDGRGGEQAGPGAGLDR